jgi:aminopeptidase N
MFLMGEEPFFLGVKDYFDAFGWSNGTIDDFLGKMQTHFDNPNFTLNDWKQSWLLTPSLNTMEIEWDSSITTTPATLKIKQNYYTPVYP